MVQYGGKSLKVTVTDTCEGCSATKIDLGDTSFAKLDSLSKGILDITWSFVDC
jgi:expansin (peptidoglycan-binding protein)